MTVIVNGTLGVTYPDGSTQSSASSGGGGGPGTFEAIQSANFTATANSIYAINTTSATVYVNLPATPSVGSYVTFIDFARKFGTNPLIINPNGSLVEGISNTSTVGTNGAAVSAIYSGSVQGWLQYSSVTTPQIGGYAANYLVVAGGGSGALAAGFTGGTSGGAGAGGYLESITTFVPGASYTITVGAGGTAVTGTTYGSGNNGSNSSIVGSTVNVKSIGGGGGGGYADATAPSGGSGGGAGYTQLSNYGTGTVGQGNRGGTALVDTPYASGGGGGATQVGFNGTGTSSPGQSGAGGNGTSSTISGAAVTRAGGGGGGGSSLGNGSNPGAGGVGGGGAGGAFGANGTSGTANTGGGGGASGANSGTSLSSGAGGSGIVILSYQGSQRGSGGTVSSAGGYTIHTFTSSGSYTA